MHHEPGRYGRSFADVYDRWYDDGSEHDTVAVVLAETAAASTVLELGLGTGRLALPIAAAGRTVTGLDASPEMLDAFAAKPEAPSVTAVLGDAGDPAAYPEGPFDLVLAAFNLLFNLTAPDAQQRCIDAAANCLSDGGVLVLDAFVPRTLEHRELDLVTRSVGPEEVVLIATDADPENGLVQGNHIELRDGSVRLRPWSIRVATPAAVDTMALRAGLRLRDRYEDYRRTPFIEGHSTHHVSVYSRSGVA